MQKLYCNSCKKYSEILPFGVEQTIPNDVVGEDRIHAYFNLLKCNCGTIRNHVQDCGCVQIDCAGPIDIVTCEFHKGYENALSTFFSFIVKMKDEDKPQEIEDDAVNLKPGFGTKETNCDCWFIKDDSGRKTSITYTYFCDYHRGFRHFVRKYESVINLSKFADDIIDDKVADAIMCLLARIDYERAQILSPRGWYELVGRDLGETSPLITFDAFMDYWNMAVDCDVPLTLGYGLHKPRNVAETMVDYVKVG